MKEDARIGEDTINLNLPSGKRAKRQGAELYVDEGRVTQREEGMKKQEGEGLAKS